MAVVERQRAHSEFRGLTLFDPGHPMLQTCWMRSCVPAQRVDHSYSQSLRILPPMKKLTPGTFLLAIAVGVTLLVAVRTVFEGVTAS